ncbi:cation transporter [Desertihabitans brevis]|uniref:Cation transporter n=1 Tax=Desertihabitans brevis TaxID=2268447 RepID=A0A367YX42_9ACTN|nr:cation diffusion facilitator family transporter [Desertihabitans brevis]RCK70307.1 cation transporter [Desertihabitans brevis]
MSGHSHSHAPSTATGEHRRRLVIAVAITTSVLIAQIVGGLVSGSLSLVADAGHVLADSTGLVIALIATGLAARPATAARTFGLRRVEILAAFANGLLLVAIAVWVLISAIDRWNEPVEISSSLMLAVAVFGALANLASLAIFVLLIPPGLGAAARGRRRPARGHPRGVDLAEVRRHIREIPGVVDVHDLHAWTITSGVPVLSAHVIVDDDCIAGGQTGIVLDRLGECLGADFDIDHCTFELEPEGHRAHEPAHHA